MNRKPKNVPNVEAATPLWMEAGNRLCTSELSATVRTPMGGAVG